MWGSPPGLPIMTRGKTHLEAIDSVSIGLGQIPLTIRGLRVHYGDPSCEQRLTKLWTDTPLFFILHISDSSFTEKEKCFIFLYKWPKFVLCKYNCTNQYINATCKFYWDVPKKGENAYLIVKNARTLTALKWVLLEWRNFRTIFFSFPHSLPNSYPESHSVGEQ